MIEKLTTPVSVATPYGQVSATHAGWGHTHQPWTGRVVSYRVLGTQVEGEFVPIQGTEEYVTIEDADLDALNAPTPQGKPANVFRNSDVIAKHKEILAQKA